MYRSTSIGILSLTSDGGVIDTIEALAGFGAVSIQQVARSVAIQPDGKILVGGSEQNVRTGADFVVMRFTGPDLTLDPTLSVSPGGHLFMSAMSGMAMYDLGGNDQLFGIASQPPYGQIVAVGLSDAGGTNDFAFLRANSDGSLDRSFNASGTPGVLLVPLAGNEGAAGAAVGPNGRILAVGTDNINDAAAVRVIGTVERPRDLSVGGSPTGTAGVVPPDGAGGYAAASSWTTSAVFGGFAGDVRTATCGRRPATSTGTGSRTRCWSPGRGRRLRWPSSAARTGAPSSRRPTRSEMPTSRSVGS
jgi:uncharacterized delta-60 repeat protein